MQISKSSRELLGVAINQFDLFLICFPIPAIKALIPEKIRTAKPTRMSALPKRNNADVEPKNNVPIPLRNIPAAALSKAMTTANPANPSARMTATAAIMSGTATGAAQIANMVNQKARQLLFVEVRAFFASFTA